jgi:hypothetical protein
MASVILSPTNICHSEPCGRRISFRLFAEFILSETKELPFLHFVQDSLLSLRMTGSEGLRVTFLPINKHPKYQEALSNPTLV